MDIRQIIRDELERREWSQRELCRKTGMMPHQLCDYLNGNRDIYGVTLESILDVLDLEIRPIVGRRRKRQR